MQGKPDGEASIKNNSFLSHKEPHTYYLVHVTTDTRAIVPRVIKPEAVLPCRHLRATPIVM
jgi:hypothetical protein